jgi:exopolyphosphatase/guanosine-5'-triphosphate,3'-diphosphate pyrophosphatase
MRNVPLATIDIGTNSVLMQVARADTFKRIEVIEDHMTITRLGKGVDRSKRLDDAAVERTLDVLRKYAARAHELGARVLAVGTSAMRDAQNGADFVARATEILGARPEVISGQREAELTFLGATQGLGFAPDAPLCVIDIGGGSTEIVRGRGLQVEAAHSLDVGAVRMHERHALTAPTTRAQLAAIEQDFARALAQSPVKPSAPIVAIAGTATTLAAIAGEVDPYDPERIHGSRLGVAQIEALLDRLAALSIAERSALPGLDPGRADVIVAGACLLLCVARAAQAHEITVSNGGVRMGLAVLELAGA